jgi:hypothetical protein
MKPSGFMQGGRMKKFMLCMVIFMFILLPALGEEQQPPKRPGGAIALNVLIGFGLGSFVLDDPLGGGIQCASELAAAALIIPGLIEMVEMLAAFWYFFPISLFMPLSISETSATLLDLGMVILASARIFGIVRPICYAARYNAGIGDEKAALSIGPFIEPCSGGEQPRLGVRLAVSYALD